MRIIKHGTGKKFHCECGCIFIAEKGDYKEILSHPNEYLYKCNCPDCGQECVTD